MTALDPLSMTLASLSWPGWQVLTHDFGHGATELSVGVGRICLYAVRSGSVQIFANDCGVSAKAVAGDILMLPHGGAHRLVAEPTESLVSGNGVPADGSCADAKLICGHYSLQISDMNPLRGQLSSFLHLNRREFRSLSECESLLTLIEDEQTQARPGHQAVASQLMQVVFHQALRAFVSRGADSQAQRQPHERLVTDPVIGLVVGLLHAQPESPWTVASLARWVNMSRSAFSERFRQVVGKPPLHYLTELRMARACYLLRDSQLGVKEIALMVGYESPSSFTNAFKRWKQVSPASFRANGTVSAVAVD